MEIATKVTTNGKLVLLIPQMGSIEEKTIGDLGELENIKKNLDMQTPREGLDEEKEFYAASLTELETKLRGEIV